MRKHLKTLIIIMVLACASILHAGTMNYIIDPTFQNIHNRTSCSDTNIMISPNWWVKTTDSTGGTISCTATKENGLRIDAFYAGSGYIYVRQMIPDVMRFSNKNLILKIQVTRASWQELDYDIYIQASMDAAGNERVLVVDSHSIALDRYENIIEISMHVPDLSGYTALYGNCLQVAIRFIGYEQNTMFYVNSMQLFDESEGADIETTLTLEQYNVICRKLEELIE